MRVNAKNELSEVQLYVQHVDIQPDINLKLNIDLIILRRTFCTCVISGLVTTSPHLSLSEPQYLQAVFSSWTRQKMDFAS